MNTSEHLYKSVANRACSILYCYLKKHSRGTWLLPVNVCPDIPLTFYLAKVSFRFVDIASDTYCININECIRLISDCPNEFCGIVYVRTYGCLKNTGKEFSDIKKVDPKIKIVDDRCLCMPEDNPDFFGADLVLYSTGHCKQIDLNGGGLSYCCHEFIYSIDNELIYDETDEEELYKTAFSENRPFREIPYGWLKMDAFLPITDYLSLIDSKKEKRIERRKMINSIYRNNLPLEIQLDSSFQNWRFNIFVPESSKNKILTQLSENHLFASSHYHSANTLFNRDKYLISDELFKHVLNLFNDEYYTEEKAFETCKIINKVIN